MTGRTQPMMPMIPRKIARVIIMMLTDSEIIRKSGWEAARNAK